MGIVNLMLTPTLPVEIRQEAAEVNSQYLYSFVTIAIRKKIQHYLRFIMHELITFRPYTLTWGLRMFGLIARCYLYTLNLALAFVK